MVVLAAPARMVQNARAQRRKGASAHHGQPVNPLERVLGREALERGHRRTQAHDLAEAEERNPPYRKDGVGNQSYRGINPNKPQSSEEELREQLSSSAEANTYLDARRAKQMQRRRTAVRKTRSLRDRASKVFNVANEGRAKFRVARVALSVWWVAFLLWIIQVVGWAISIMGIILEAASSQLDAKELLTLFGLMQEVPGGTYVADMIPDLSLAQVVPGMTVFFAGYFISIIPALATLTICAVMFAANRVHFFRNESQICSFLVAFNLYLTPLVNVLPFGLIWFWEVFITAGTDEPAFKAAAVKTPRAMLKV